MLNLISKYIFSKVSKKLKYGTYTRTGKNFSGKICVFRRGGGNKKTYNIVDFYRRLNAFGVVCEIKYDAYRSAFIGLILYDNGLFSNIILSETTKLGHNLFSGVVPANKYAFSKSSSFSLNHIPLFSLVNNVEVKPFFGSSLSRAAGVSAVVTSNVNNIITLKLRSGWLVKVSANSVASLGCVSNMIHNMKTIGKAGKNRGLGKRPIVRGVAMNPCDHPHGGGNGKTSPPALPCTPWGKFTKWVHTKKKKIDKLHRRLYKQIR